LYFNNYYFADFATSTCLQGWESRGSFCYEFVTQEKTWAESESYCQSKGGHQISFSDASERVSFNSPIT